MRAAWNYQGFFFGYHVKQDAERFYFPSLWRMGHNHNTGGVGYRKVEGVKWAYRGDHLRLMFDTLDARLETRGDPHTQEFVVFPAGTESDPTLPGIERVIASRRDAERKQYRGVRDSCKMFPQQSPPETGPDGSGPYRVTKRHADGYTVEVFIPRSLFNVPVFAPGWYVGFDCAVGSGAQGRRFKGQGWAHFGRVQPDDPDDWGDLLLLGTDPRLVVQEASSSGRIARQLVPGHSYLFNVVDPDRNVNVTVRDTVLVSAEVTGERGDVEVFILKESGKNTGVFRGYINTQPGQGRTVQGVLEVMPLQQVKFGYVDFADARGRRDTVSRMTLPVVSPVTQCARSTSR
jgi:hypothetical protein